MNERAQRILEFTKIRDMLAGKAQSPSGREKCLALTPSGDLSEVTHAQTETEEALVVLTFSGQNPIGPFTDVSDPLSLAAKGSTLSPRMLLAIADVLKSSAQVRSALVTDRENTPLITACASLLQPLTSLCRDITDSILSEDEIADQASSELADIRRHIRAANDRIRDRLNSMAHGNAYSKYLMEPIITLRNGRYVLPVRQEYRQYVPGLVHDQSSTGATLYIEPMAVVELGNELKEWHVKEKNEIDRILAALSGQAGSYADQIKCNIENLTHLDFVFAKAELAREMNAIQPKLNDRGRIRLVRARHPLIPRETVVPLTLWLGEDFTTLVITGPNTGGKTVTLKTIGLFCMMAQAGLQLPADLGTETAVFNEIYADIGDEQSIEQSLSTFSSHMKNIVEITENVCGQDLVLFDELGAGTDPQEGAALAQAILASLTEKSIRTCATTHYSELKSYALTSRGVENASVEFDITTLRPTYRLSIGVPGKSNAFDISRRLGLDGALIDQAKELLSHETVRFEDVIANAEYHRRIAEKERALAEEARQETVRLKDEAEKLYAHIAKTKDTSERKAKEDARRIVEKARRDADEILRQMRTLKNSAPSQEVNALKHKLDRELDAYSDGIAPEVTKSVAPDTVHAGDTVRILTLNADGTVLTAPDAKGEVTVQAGALKMKTALSNLRLLEVRKEKPRSAVHSSKSAANLNVSMQCDLRGMNLEEAIAEADRYLDSAYLAGLHEVTLIHGKGTGILRSGIQQHLKKVSHVKSFRLGMYGEGEDGVTVVTLK